LPVRAEPVELWAGFIIARASGCGFVPPPRGAACGAANIWYINQFQAMAKAHRDIRDRGDVEKLVTRFYERIIVDDVIGYIFTLYANINLDEHLPILTDFWESILFDVPVYKRGSKAMNVHIDLAKRVPLRKQHFTRWLYLFNSTVDELFTGERALKAKNRASSIAETMQKRIGPLPECGLEVVAV